MEPTGNSGGQWNGNSPTMGPYGLMCIKIDTNRITTGTVKLTLIKPFYPKTFRAMFTFEIQADELGASSCTLNLQGSLVEIRTNSSASYVLYDLPTGKESCPDASVKINNITDVQVAIGPDRCVGTEKKTSGELNMCGSFPFE